MDLPCPAELSVTTCRRRQNVPLASGECDERCVLVVDTGSRTLGARSGCEPSGSVAMKIGLRLIGPLLILVLAASAFGCTTTKTIRPAADPSVPSFVNVKAGDTIIVHLRDGRQVQVIVQRVDTDGVVSMEGVRYARGDISHLRRRSVSGWKTGFAIGGAVAGAYVVAAILVVVALDSLW
jgi:hypothetical protein